MGVSNLLRSFRRFENYQNVKTCWKFSLVTVKAEPNLLLRLSYDSKRHTTSPSAADIQKLWGFLESARQTHGGVDYERLAAPYLLQIQKRQQEVLDYLSAKPKPAGV